MKIGFLSQPFSGHLNPMITLGRKLQSRAHEVIFFGVPDVKSVVRAAGLKFVSFCEEEYPLGSMAVVHDTIAKYHGEEAFRYHMGKIAPHFLEVGLKCLPEVVAEVGVDAMLVDRGYPFIQLVPMSLGIPFVQISTVLNMDVSGVTPASIFSWPYEDTPEARARNIEGLKKFADLVEPLSAVVKSYANEVGLRINWNNANASVTSKLAVISQTPKEFDFPGIPWPEQFHYAGPLHDNADRISTSFPWEKLGAKPMIYASLGTLVNGVKTIYTTILQTVAKLQDVDVVLSVGGNESVGDLGPISSNTIVTGFAPQIELLKHASLCITHAGLNTVLESLSQGVPMVAIPNTYDQPGVAARIAYHGVGEFIEIEDLTIDGLSALIQMVLNNPRYSEKARYFQKVIAETGGLDLAADLIEEAFQRYQNADPAEKRRLVSPA